MTRVCIRCGEEKDVSLFKRDKRRLGRLTNHCKTCHNLAARNRRMADPQKAKEYQRNWRDTHRTSYKAYSRSYNLKKLFGLTVDEYTAMLDRQNGKCAICKLPETRTMPSGLPFPLGVDHNHSNGKVRDLLCHMCNMAIGVLESVRVSHEQLFAYIDKWDNK